MLSNEATAEVLVLDLLGAILLIRCRHAACWNGIRRHFAPHCRESLRRTPDIVVECDMPEADRYLFRARPPEEYGQPLVGVRVRPFGAPESREWTSLYPPIPPFALPPIRNRFIGLHAAAVDLGANSTVLLVGDRGTGKTTLATRLVNDLGGSLLTDEVVCLHTRSLLVAPFAMAMGVVHTTAEGGRSKIPTPANVVVCRVADRPAPATHCVFLTCRIGSAGRLTLLDRDQAFQRILPHHVDIGAEMDEALVTLADLTSATTSAELVVETHADLERWADAVLEFVDSGQRH